MLLIAFAAGCTDESAPTAVRTDATVDSFGKNGAPAMRVDAEYCEVADNFDNPNFLYLGDSAWVQYSKGKTGHATYKCKMNLEVGDPVFVEFGGTWGDCERGTYWVELDGDKGMFTIQCFEYDGRYDVPE